MTSPFSRWHRYEFLLLVMPMQILSNRVQTRTANATSTASPKNQLSHVNIPLISTNTVLHRSTFLINWSFRCNSRVARQTPSNPANEAKLFCGQDQSAANSDRTLNRDFVVIRQFISRLFLSCPMLLMPLVLGCGASSSVVVRIMLSIIITMLGAGNRRSAGTSWWYTELWSHRENRIGPTGCRHRGVTGSNSSLSIRPRKS